MKKESKNGTAVSRAKKAGFHCPLFGMERYTISFFFSFSFSPTPSLKGLKFQGTKFDKSRLWFSHKGMSSCMDIGYIKIHQEI